jgi:phage terminase Nu1 subunit (DNA packaging protein)
MALMPHLFLTKATTMHEFTINRCAEMLGKDRATVGRALRNVPPDAGTAKRPLYRLATVADALAAHSAKPDGRHGNGDTARLAAARTELAREQAESARLKNMYARGELVRASMVERGAMIIFGAFRERCLSIPGKIASICEMRSRGEIEEIVRAEIYECLEELSRPILSVDRPPMEDGSHASADDEEEIIR